MARKARHRISYVLPLANSPGGHRLGVNGLAIDPDLSILYSGGRDGVICAWNLDLDLESRTVDNANPFASAEDTSFPKSPKSRATSFHRQVQAHTHWINDILLTQGNTAVVTASSDLTVKLWRPQSEEENHIPSTLGLHTDYVKCLASPGVHADWVASGGLDHKIRLWDLDGCGEKLQIDTSGSEGNAKGSVYALSVRGSVMASGGPESIVRLWDSRIGKRITSLVGHTDNIRDILINQEGDTVMTASSDQSIKVWSITAGRCMYTLTMHNDSVWSLYSDHPQLSLFYSADRSGLIAKTDVRGCEDMDQGLSIAIAQEQEGVSKIVVAGDYFWTATSSSSINRWRDVDTRKPIQTQEQLQRDRQSSIVSRTNAPSSPLKDRMHITRRISGATIPLACVLRISNNAPMPGQKPRDIEDSTIYSGISARKLSEAITDTDLGIVTPYSGLPEETIEGQNGLIKHIMLNDKRRVLTLDTAGEVTLWDLLKCVPVKSFGKRHLEDVHPEVNTVEAVANWCGVDTRTGRLAVVLEENFCFDAEMYADEWVPDDAGQFREDQRINLGKWILRFLFSKLIDEQLVRDTDYRTKTVSNASKLSRGFRRENAPASISLPPAPPPKDSPKPPGEDDSMITPKALAINGAARPATTPGLTIAVATPHPNGAPHNTNTQQNHLPPTAEEGASLEKTATQTNQTRSSTDKSADYFSSTSKPKSSLETARTENNSNAAPDGTGQPAADGEKDEKHKEGSSFLGKKFRMNFPKKLGGRNSTDTRPPPLDEKAEESDKSEDKEDREVQDNMFGTIQKIRLEYDDMQHAEPLEPLIAGVVPSPITDTPDLHLPPFTTVIIQEEAPDSGGVADLYRGTIDSIGRDTDVIEKIAPMWLGELLLRNRLPAKEIPKVSFVLMPYQDSLPSIASSDGNNRLNANRMLRAKKILVYVAERIEPQPEEPDPDAMKPEEYLDLLCQDQVVDHNTTLATLRTHIWKTGGDVVLYYKSNGRRPDLENLVRKNSTHEGTAKTGPVVGHNT